MDRDSYNLFSVTVLGYIVVFLVYFYWKISRKHILKLAEKIPGPKGLPFIGNALFFLGSSADIFLKLIEVSQQFKHLGKIWIGPRLLVFLYDPNDIELILNSQIHIDKSSEYKFFKPWLGEGLLTSSGDKWRNHRKLIAPTFHLNVLKSFIDLFNQNSKSLVEKLKMECGNTFDCHDYMSEVTVEILLETAMGVNKTKQGKSCYEYALAVLKMCDILHFRQTKIWLMSDFIFNLSKYANLQKQFLATIHGFTTKVIRNKKLQRKLESGVITNDSVKLKEAINEPRDFSFGQVNGLKDDLDNDDNIYAKKRVAFLDLMLEASENGVVITDKEIKEQVDTIMFEGHDTTAAAGSFFLNLMGLYPEIQQKVQKEQDDIFGDSDRPATFADTLEMKYLERCILETLRLFPPVPIIARKLNQDQKLVSGDYTIPAGATVIVTPIKLHRNPEIFSNPDVFNPDNFLADNCAKRHYYSFIPFSAGPRSCVGRKYAMLKLKILLSTIMRNFTVESSIPQSEFKLQADIILKRKDGFPVSVKVRKIKAN